MILANDGHSDAWSNFDYETEFTLEEDCYDEGIPFTLEVENEGYEG